jgi:hypothetical protein
MNGTARFSHFRRLLLAAVATLPGVSLVKIDCLGIDQTWEDKEAWEKNKDHPNIRICFPVTFSSFGIILVIISMQNIPSGSPQSPYSVL